MNLHGIDAPPGGVRGRILESSPENLVIYIPGAGVLATVFLVIAVVCVSLAGLVSVWAVEQIRQGANPDHFVRPGLWIWVGTVFAICCAVKLKFERTFLLVDRQRLVVQRVVLGFKRRKQIALVPSSRAQVLTPKERGASLDGVKVLGKDGTARFGHAFSFVENDWIAARINSFLQGQLQSAEAAERAGWLDPEDLPREGNIRVDASLPGLLEFHYVVNPNDSKLPGRALLTAVMAASFWLVILPMTLLLLSVPFPIARIGRPLGIALLIGGGLAIHGVALYAWIEAFGRITVSLTRRTLSRRKDFFWFAVSRSASTPTDSIDEVRVEHTGNLRHSVVCVGEPTVVLPGFSDEEDARKVAALIQTRLRQWRPAVGRHDSAEEEFEFLLPRPWWQRLGILVGLACATIGSLYLIDPLLLWLVPTTAVSGLALNAAFKFGGSARMPTLAVAALAGLVSAALAIAIIPFSWTTGPIRYAGGRVDPFGVRMCIPLFGTHSACSVTFRGSTVTDPDLEYVRPTLLASFSDMELLDLSETRITDKGLKHLAGLTFRGVSLQGTSVTDAGLAHLVGNSKFHWLYLNDTRIGDAGMVHVKQMTELGKLYLNDTQVTDAGIAELKGLTHMVWLGLEGTQLTDAGLADLKGMRALYELQLGNTQVTDAGLENLKDLNSLRTLGLDNTRTTDAGLDHLAGLPFLLNLSLRNTQVTDSGIEQLRRKMSHPYLSVTR